jgi:hypothetical protein
MLSKLTCLSVMLTIWDCGRAHGVPSSAPYKWVYKAVIIYDNENRYHNKIHYRVIPQDADIVARKHGGKYGTDTRPQIRAVRITCVVYATQADHHG